MTLSKNRPEGLAPDVPWKEPCGMCNHLSEEHYWDFENRKYKKCSWCPCMKFVLKESV
jgi:hypothetical protein